MLKYSSPEQRNNFNQTILWWCSNKEPSPFPRGDYREIMKIHLQNIQNYWTNFNWNWHKASMVDGDSSLYRQVQKQQQMMLKFGIRQILCKKPWIPFTPKYAVINLVAIGTSVLEKTILTYHCNFDMTKTNYYLVAELWSFSLKFSGLLTKLNSFKEFCMKNLTCLYNVFVTCQSCFFHFWEI